MNSKTRKESFVIIGGCAAGMSAASKAKRLNPNLEVTALEKTAHVSYSACGIPYYVSDLVREASELITITPEEFSKKRGKHIPILVRFPAEKVRKSDLFDYKTWIKEGWIDYLCPSNIQGRHQHFDIAPYVEALKTSEVILLPVVDALGACVAAALRAEVGIERAAVAEGVLSGGGRGDEQRRGERDAGRGQRCGSPERHGSLLHLRGRPPGRGLDPQV